MQSPYRRGTVILIVVLGTYISFVTWHFTNKQEQERIHTGFLSRAQTQATVAAQRLRSYEEMVYSVRDAFLGQNTVTRQEFAQVAQAVLQRHAGVQALEWVQIVPRHSRAAFELQASRELNRPVVIRRRGPDGTMQPAPEAEEYFAIDYVEPLAGNEAVLGYDITSAPSAPMLVAARRDRGFKVSQTFPLAQPNGPDVGPGVVFILPFSRSRLAENPVEGFVQGVFHVQAMLAQSHQLTTNEALDTYYLDAGPGQNPPILLYANLGGVEPMHQPGAKVDIPPLDDPADFHETIAIGGRQWRMIIRKNGAWAEHNSSQQPILILAAGLAITALLALFLNNLLQRTSRIEQEVEERTRQLRASEARLQDILDHSPALIFLKDLEGRYLVCNQPLAILCQRPHDEIIGKTDAQLFPAAQVKLYREHDAVVMAVGRPMEFEEPAVTAQGPRTYFVHKFPLRDEKGHTYALCGIATDITDRKAAEDQKLRLERQLLESQKLESLGVLAGGIAHDFNNILTAILGNASLAGMELSKDHKIQPQLRQIEHASRRAADLCAQMLAYAGKAAFIIAPVNLTSLVRDTAALLEVTVGKRARLELQIAEGLPAAQGDITQLRQIVMNLVLNAADAMGQRADGVITVTTFCRDLPADFFQQAVQAPAMEAGRYVGLEVRDNGSGMTPEVLARIFEPFFTTKFSGRGLGLAAVLGIIQSHKGALFVDTVAGQGTSFRFFLPVAAAGTVHSSHHPFGLLPEGNSLHGTVLLVDDEQAVRRVTVTALTSLGLKAIEAADGHAAIRLYQGQPDAIDLILLDLTMPGISGEETISRLREINPEARIIVMSGYSEGETMQRCAMLGISGYLPKPFELADLAVRLRLHLG
jgi:two-component system cell cycle sensor histidine kinase/response regulator CckA